MKALKCFFIFFLISFYSCKENEADVKPEESFLKIYSDESFENAFVPIDMVQSTDSSFFILGSYDRWKTYVMKVDKEGKFLWDAKLETNFVNPVPGLFEVNGAFLFFCMDEITLQTQLLQLSGEDSAPTIVKTFDGIIYPLYVSRVDIDNYLILSYDRNAIASRITKLDSDFNEMWSVTGDYSVLEDVEPEIIAHITRNGERLPFFVGTSQGKYFFNGFSNYSFSLHFLDQSGAMTGVINGFRNEGSVSAAMNISGNIYSIAHNSFNHNFILPQLSISENAISTTSELGGTDHPEIAQRALVGLSKINVLGEEMITFATTTKSNQIILYFYDLTGVLKGSKRLGFNNPYELVRIIQTSDGGLAILGNTHVAGRFSRICLFKISRQQLIDMVIH